MNTTQVLRIWQTARRWMLLAFGVLLLVGVPVTAWRYFANSPSHRSQFVPYVVVKSDLPIVVQERGSLESQVRTEIRCEVENSSVDRGGNYGTQIIFIVPNGSAVRKGDLLVELDSAAIRDKLDLQVLNHQRAVSAHIQAKAKYENQKTQNDTLLAEAHLKQQLAELLLKMYMDEESGEHKLALEEIERTIDETRNMIDEAKAALALQRTERVGIETLFKLGYRGKNDLEQSRFKLLQAEDKLASAVNRLTTTEASRQQLESYTFKMKQLTLVGDVETAKRSVKQVITDNDSKLAQALAANEESAATESKEQERLEKLRTQVGKCKIFAPHDGMAVYARDDRYGEAEISEGISVRERQQILSLPDLSQMQVKTRIHEAVLDQVVAGLPVSIRVDAFPNRAYTGVVESVAVVPASNGWGGSSVKTYDCVIRIPEKVQNLKPGMTAVADIHVDRIRNVLAVPVQAVVQIDKKSWCYLDGPEGPSRREIQLGRSNDKFVHVTDGLALNDRVVLDPMSLFDEEQSDGNEIAPDSGAPEVPQLPVEKIAEKPASTKEKAPSTKKKRSGPRPPKAAPAEGKTAPVRQAAAGE